MIFSSKDPLDSKSKVRIHFFRKPTFVLSLQQSFAFKYKYFLIPKQQYFVFSALPGKEIFENFSQSLWTQLHWLCC